jgi:polyhydroxyalkanoate synthesis regulator phasin
MSDERDRSRDPVDGIFDGVRSVTGVLGALVEALEKSFDELRAGDLSPERAREAAKSAVRRAQETVEQLRERVEFVPRREFDAMRAEIAVLTARVVALEGAARETVTVPDAADPGPATEESEAFPFDEG